MSVVLKITTVAIFLCLVQVGIFAAVLPEVRSRQSLSQANYVDQELSRLGDGEGIYVSGNLLDTLLARPSKRQWCRKGMIYNHVLGSCTLSLSALRGRSKWH